MVFTPGGGAIVGVVGEGDEEVAAHVGRHAARDERLRREDVRGVTLDAVLALLEAVLQRERGSPYTYSFASQNSAILVSFSLQSSSQLPILVLDP